MVELGIKDKFKINNEKTNIILIKINILKIFNLAQQFLFDQLEGVS